MSLVIRDRKANFVKVYRIFEALLNLRSQISYNLHNSDTNSSQSPSYLLKDERATSLHNDDNV